MKKKKYNFETETFQIIPLFILYNISVCSNKKYQNKSNSIKVPTTNQKRYLAVILYFMT